MSEEAIKIFYSYSRKDLDMRNTLEDHLSALREANKISTWHDLQLEAGTEWEPAILNKLDTADIILLLVSRNFIASKYCYGTELKRAIERHNEGTARVIPIILRSCDWNQPYVPFSKLNVLPTHAKAITSWADQDEAFAIVAQRIRETVNQLRTKKLPERQRHQELEQQVLKEQREEMQRRQAAQTVNANELASEKGIDYTRLRDLLKAGQWKEADKETNERMCEVMGRQRARWLEIKDIQNFPCIELHTVDQLWVKHSKGKFGFSAQRKIWNNCGSPTTYKKGVKFGEEVGWKIRGGGVSWRRGDSELQFDISAPSGHLPYYLLRSTSFHECAEIARVFPFLVLRLVDCGIL